MATSDTTESKPLWLLMEERIHKLDPQALAGEKMESTVQQVAGDLDSAGCNVSGHGGNMLDLRWALEKAHQVGRPMLKDFNAAIAALTLEDAADPFKATDRILDDLGQTWPELRSGERRPVVVEFVEDAKLSLLIAKAKGLSGEEGIRMLIEEEVADEVITDRLEITEDQLKEVHEKIKAERAERARVAGLLEKVEGKSKEEQVRHLFDNNVAEELMIEMAEVDQGVIDSVKLAMEEEIKEKQRLAEEEAARKKKEAEGPSLEDIPADQMIDYIDSIREIMEFSDVEKEIRTMCEQSSIPKALIDIAVTEPDKLDELEKQAEG